MSRDSRIDWSEEKRREMLILQRRSMWHDDTVANLAMWQKVQIEILQKSWLHVDAFSKAMEKEKKEFLAGGGDPAEFDRYRNISDGHRKILSEQLEKGEMSWCAGSRLFIVKGRKPI